MLKLSKSTARAACQCVPASAAATRKQLYSVVILIWEKFEKHFGAAFLNSKYMIMMIRQSISSSLQLVVAVCALIAAPKAHLALMAV
mmetsp:Transcript_11630/g.27980  ORF Transcript_11630/g.27980 Transcript_11630/m.27980 type:complete len:87 (-) Transcript_11630:274-534(-)